MPNRNKNRQKNDQLELVDEYVREYIMANHLPFIHGQSETEKRCATYANSARDVFKERRNKRAVSAKQEKIMETAGIAAAAAAEAAAGFDFQYQTTQHQEGDDISGSTGAGSSSSHTSSDHSLNAGTSNATVSGATNKPRNLSAAEKYNIRLNNNRRSAHATKVFNEVYRREMSKALLAFESQLKQQHTNNIHNGNTTRELELEIELTKMKQQNDELERNLTIEKLRNAEMSAQLQLQQRFTATTTQTQQPTHTSNQMAINQGLRPSASNNAQQSLQQHNYFIHQQSSSTTTVPMSELMDGQNQQQQQQVDATSSTKPLIMPNIIPASSPIQSNFLSSSQQNQGDGILRHTIGSEDMFETPDFFTNSQGTTNQ